MAFMQVKSVQERKALIDKFLKNREILKKRIIDEKIGKQRFREDVARLLQQQIKEELDKQQDKLISKLKESQKALATTQVGSVYANLPPLTAITVSPAPEASETATGSSHVTHHI